ncbi:kinase-like domain-containing protein [Mycena amicta]|nr:kinase-like domain-containing protein [Mycena amicta]
MWLTKNKDVLRRTALQDPELVSYMHVAENVYMISHVRRALPLRFMSCIFAGLLKTCNNNNSRLDDFRSKIQLWKTWDTMTCLINFRVVLSTTFELSKLIKEEDLPRPMINVAIHTDILCVCAQLADVLRDAANYLYFVRTKDEDAQKLLDLIQDLLDYPLLDDGIRPVILKALLKLSAKSGLHPRCFALSDRLQLEGHQIAAGSFGDVWKGTIGSEIVSVKVMRVYEEGDAAALLKEFYREALIWRQLSHPNLLPFLGAYYLEGSRSRLCLVSPWMEKGNIVRYLKNNPVGVNRLSLVLDVALGLEHLHRLKLVHGDLKAINVLANSSGQAVLADFGLSSVIDSKILLSTSTVKMGGTVRWQAPELFTGTKNSFSSDIYAFACVCYEIFTGYVPFWELTNDVAVMFQVIQGQRPKRSPGNIPEKEKLWRLMTECWDGDPEKRPTAPQVVFTLRDRGIGAVPTSETADWESWYTSKFRSSLEEHTLFLSCGSVDDWQQFTRMQKEEDMLSGRRAVVAVKTSP